MATYKVQRKNRDVGVINANNDGFVLINAEDIWPLLLEIKGIGHSPVTTITCKNILSVRLDIPFKSMSEFESHIRNLLKKTGCSLEPFD